MATSLPSVAPVRAGKLYMRVFEQPISGEKVVGFLRHVLREARPARDFGEADDRGS